MTIKEKIHAAIEDVQNDRLDELYSLIRNFAKAPPAPHDESIMDKLKRIQIEGPPDFSANFDKYVSGEKRV
ncbi:MAG: hypothetical protein K8R36_17460 [Planctomycetales bacterium]|nr:hypothetical protein [Planctomycetales bacterium]